MRNRVQMGITLTGLDMRRREEAHKINGGLIGTGMSVAAGGRKGPYSLTVERLSRKRLLHLIEVIRAAQGGRRG